MKFRDLAWVAARIFVGFVLAYAGYSKLTEPIENFRGMLANYEVLPYALLQPVAAVTPWVELISGGFLILGYAPRWSSLAAAGLCLTFLLVLGSSDLFLNAGSKECGCFGQNGPIHLTLHQVFALDAVNFALSLRLFFLKEYPFSLDRFLRKAR